MKTYTATISDGGASVERTIQAEDIEAACVVIEQEMREAEEVTADNPDCEPRTEWTCHVTDDYAECSLRAEGEQNSSAWAKVRITQ